MRRLGPIALTILAAASSAQVDFNRDVRPILSDRCYACHGPDEAQREGGLRLDVPGAAALTDGTVLERILATDPLDRMPPPDQKKQLAPKDIEVLRRWIEDGATYEAHWSFMPPESGAPPTPVEGWPARNVIDHHVQAELRERGLAPSPEADRRTLIRRLSLDLRGLPPSRAEVEAFVADPSEDAYERLVDTYLSSPHHGERLAMQWLDASRYADTNGYHIDNERRMWRWRDWVIDAFNDNTPYDAFVVEQLAGDLLPEPTVEQRIATGFNRNHMINFEGGAIPEEYLNEYIVDRVNTTSSVFMGLTVNCAQCHDHKYDPISQREYYQLYAFFNGVPELGLNGRQGNADPIMLAPTPEQAERLAPLDARVTEIRALLDGPMPEIDDAQRQWTLEQRARLESAWTTANPTRAEATGGGTFVTLEDDSLRIEGTNPPKDVYDLDLVAPEGGIRAVRLEILTDPSMFEGGPGRADNGNLVVTGIEAHVGDRRLPVATFHADFAQDTFPASFAIDDDPASGWAIAGYERHEPRLAILTLATPVEEGETLTLRIRQESVFAKHAIGRLRLATTADPTIAGALTPSTRGQWARSGPWEGALADDLPPESADTDVTWTTVEDVDGPVHSLGDTPSTVTYLRRTITAPTARTVTFSLGSDDGVRLRVNGEVLHDVDVPRAAAIGQDLVEVPLRAGENEVLLKIANGGGPTAYAFDLLDDGEPDLPTMHAIMRGDEDRLREVYRTTHSPLYRELTEGLDAAIAARDMVRAEISDTMVMAEAEGERTAMVLDRGLYDKPTIEVGADVPAALGALPDDAPHNRLGLAEWLVRPEHPLTARVAVNRLWQLCFGRGIVATPLDFGAQGEFPTHQALLDALAVRYARDWDTRDLLRLMVTSHTYRQSSVADPGKMAIDPQNLFLWRASRLRLPAESIRDQALVSSDLLVTDIGGPSVMPYQPEGLWKDVAYDPSGREFTGQVYMQGEGPDLYRRSMYTYWKRSSPPPELATFDAPNREICLVERARTNTPLQALVLLNSPTFVEASRVLAQRVMHEVTGDDARLDRMFEHVLSRRPTDPERHVLRDILARETFTEDDASALVAVGASAADPTLDPTELARWMSIASIILNLDEAITRG